MKKRMLITTIVMMLVLATALTTSSLAWFTASQSTVTATGGTFTASTSGSVVNIGVATAADATTWDSTAAMTTTGSKSLDPLCAIAKFETSLNADLTKTTQVEEDGNTVDKTVAVELDELVKAKTLNGARFLTDGEGVQVFPLNNANKPSQKSLDSQANSVIFAKNLAKETDINSLKITLKITGFGKDKDGNDITDAGAAPNFYIVLATADGKAVLRTAVISKAGNTTSNIEDGYVVFDFNGEDVEGPLALSDVDNNENRVEGDATIENEKDATASVTFTDLEWKPNTVYSIHVYAWYEGHTLDVTTEGCTTTYELSIEGGVKSTSTSD